jgi:hypothetical protein
VIAPAKLEGGLGTGLILAMAAACAAAGRRGLRASVARMAVFWAVAYLPLILARLVLLGLQDRPDLPGWAWTAAHAAFLAMAVWRPPDPAPPQPEPTRREEERFADSLAALTRHVQSLERTWRGR